MVKECKVKQTPTRNLQRGAFLPDKDKKFATWSAKTYKKMMDNSDLKEKTYGSFAELPDCIKDIYNKIYSNDEDICSKPGGKKSDISVKCVAYPPGCHSVINGTGINDSTSLYVYGGVEVVTAEPDPRIMEMAGFKLPKGGEINSRQIYFRDGGSYFVDEYPFSIISNYTIRSRTDPVCTIPASKGGRPKKISLGRKDKWILFFTRTCGHHTIEKIIKTVTGKGSDSLNLGEEASKMFKKALKNDNISNVIDMINTFAKKEKPKSDEPVSADVMEAFEDIGDI